MNMTIDVQSDQRFTDCEQFDPIVLIGKSIFLYHRECVGGKIVVDINSEGGGIIRCTACEETYNCASTEVKELKKSLRIVLITGKSDIACRGWGWEDKVKLVAAKSLKGKLGR